MSDDLASAPSPGGAPPAQSATPQKLRVNLVELPPEVYPAPPPAPAPPPPRPRAPRQAAAAPMTMTPSPPANAWSPGPDTGPSAGGLPNGWTGPGHAPPPASPPPAPLAAGPVQLPSPPPQSPPSQAIGGLLDLVSVPALHQLGLSPEETHKLLGSVKGALDAWNEGAPQQALQVPESMQKASKILDQFLPSLQEIVLPRLPHIIESVKSMVQPPAPPPAPSPPPPQPEPQPATPAQRARIAPASVKEQLKRKAGQLVTDASGKAISFPDEAREDDVFTPRASTPREERGYYPGGSVSGGGVHSPPDMARETRRETKIQFYGHKESAPGQDVGRSTTRPDAPARTMGAFDYIHEGPREDRPNAADLPVEAIRNLAVQDKSYTPANSPEGTWADERRESIQPTPAELHADDDAAAPLPVGAPPSARELQSHTEAPMSSDDSSILTEAERELILGGLKGQDPLVLEGLVLGGVDISAFVLPKKDKLSPEQRARIKRAEFANVLREADAMSDRDTEFAKRWAVLNKPKGREWLKKNLKAIQAGL